MLIGIAGPAGGGKDTIAEGLSELFLLDVDRFAAQLYAMARAIDTEIHPKMSHEKKEAFLLDDPELGTRRNFLQKLGTEFGRELIHEDLWVRGTMHRVGFLPTVLADVRFESEAEAIRERGGLVIHLRPDWIYFPRDHASANPLKPKTGDLVAKLTYGNSYEDIQSIASKVAAHFERRSGN